MRRPNVLWIMTDQQNTNTLGCYGNRAVRTPNIDALAASGALFENAYVTIPLCVPSRASIWSARYPHRAGVLLNDDDRDIRLGDDVETLGDLANSAGYDCAYIGKWHIGRERTPQHGFGAAWWTHLRGSYEQDLEEQGIFSFEETGAATPLGARLAQRGQVPYEKAHDTIVTDRTIEFLKAAKGRDRPFLAICSMRAPHDPYIGPFDDLYDPASVELPVNHLRDPGTLPGHVARSVPRIWFEGLTRGRDGAFAEDKLRMLIARYWGLVHLVDRNVGRLMATLDELDLARDTIVVFMSDHGDLMGAHGLVSKGNCMFDGATKVPLIISHRGHIPPGRRSARLASTIDIVPTLLELMSVPQPAVMDGMSLRQYWDYGFNTRDSVFMQVWETYGLFDPVLAVRTDRWKYSWRIAGGDELYDMRDDPHETVNLATDRANADVIRGLKGRVTEWLSETGDIPLSRLSRANKGFTDDF